MPSVVDICNSALDKLGHGSIMSLDDGNTTADLCKRNWPLVRDRLLRDHPWSFAMKRVALAPANPPPAWGYSARFPFPSDLMRLVEVLDHSTDDYLVEGQAILANDSVLYVRYVAVQEDSNKFPSLFGDVAAARLAVELCEAVIQSTTKKQALWEEYEDAYRRAARANAQENPPRVIEEDDWNKVRY